MGFRILYIVANRTGEGTFWRAYHFGRILSERGHSVDLLCNSPHSRIETTAFEQDGVQIIETPDLFPKLYLSGWDVWNVGKRIAAIHGKQYDIVHAFESRPGVLLPAIAKKRGGAALFMDWADWFGKGGSVEERSNPIVRTLLRPPETFFENRFRKLPVGTTAINQVLFNRAVDMGVNSENLLLIRNGCDVRLHPLERNEARAKLGFNKDQILIGYIGRAFERDARFMAQAVNQLVSILDTARLLIIGTFNRPILNWIDDPDNILASGRVSRRKLHTYISACDLCWLPLADSNANRGRLPMKLNDYLTAGRAVISTSVGDLQQLIPEYEIGKVTLNNPKSFTRATIELLQSPTELQRLCQNARRTAEVHLNWETLTDRLYQFYETQLAVNINTYR
jgi:glycosyltransferase involved in cell wall biosynthesis